MIDAYLNLIKNGKRTIESVPEWLRAEVQACLDDPTRVHAKILPPMGSIGSGNINTSEGSGLVINPSGNISLDKATEDDILALFK